MFVQPPFQRRPWVEAAGSAVDDRELGLHVPLEVIDRHPERGGCLLLVERKAWNLAAMTTCRHVHPDGSAAPLGDEAELVGCEERWHPLRLIATRPQRHQDPARARLGTQLFQPSTCRPNMPVAAPPRDAPPRLSTHSTSGQTRYTTQQALCDCFARARANRRHRHARGSNPEVRRVDSMCRRLERKAADTSRFAGGAPGSSTSITSAITWLMSCARPTSVKPGWPCSRQANVPPRRRPTALRAARAPLAARKGPSTA